MAGDNASAAGGIGRCMRELRKSVGHRQADLASAVQMSTTALSRIETGKVRPDPASLRLLLAAMGLAGDACRLLDILMRRGVL